jgi:hypothetical protein
MQRHARRAATVPGPEQQRVHGEGELLVQLVTPGARVTKRPASEAVQELHRSHFQRGDHMRRQNVLIAAILALTASSVHGQEARQDSTYGKIFVGSTLTMLGNFAPTNSPEFVQLNLGYRLTPKDVISIEAMTWKYAWPLGIPYGKSFEAEEERYPGYVRETGVALVYQRFVWKGAYAAVHAMSGLQKYVDADNKKIQNGYQLFMTYRLGYHVQLFNNRFFIEPSVAMTHWPINTNVPASFAALEAKWPNHFLFEPGFHFGYNVRSR